MTGSCQAVSHQVVVSQSSLRTPQAVFRKSSGSCQGVSRQSLGSHLRKIPLIFSSYFYFSFIPKILRYDLMFADWSTYLVDRKFKMMTNFTFATKTNPPLIEGTSYFRTVRS